MAETVDAWHFVGNNLRDGRPVPADGVTLKHDGPIKLCSKGFHASLRLIDALVYASGSTICRARMSGNILYGDDKLVASERTILWRIDGEKILQEFARLCALQVIHLWDAPDVVRKYLETGDKELRGAARNAILTADAARGAARNAARDATWTGDAECTAICAADAARKAAGKDALEAQNKKLTEMVMGAHND